MKCIPEEYFWEQGFVNVVVHVIKNAWIDLMITMYACVLCDTKSAFRLLLGQLHGVQCLQITQNQTDQITFLATACIVSFS